jgi:DNA polymerase-3 subunit gamma/tau
VIALARKYRPRRFSDLLVQDHVAAALRGAVARNRVGHGYLLTGPRGTGKTTAARILAMALNCERRLGESAGPLEGEPCGECASCQRIWSGTATLDVVEIDAASNRGVDDARDLRERAMYAASQEGRHKVYIIDEAHMLTREAWNALLKILEEPPPGVVFVFATTEPQKIASTAAPVLSRLQRFDFRRIGPGAIRDRLREVLGQEGLRAEEDALAVIARYADGGMRDALSVLDQVLSFGEGPITAAGVRQVLGLIDDEQYGEVLRAIAGRNSAAVFPLVERLVDAGADLAEFMTGTADLLRALLMVESGVAPEGLTETQRQAIEAARGTLAPADVVRMLSLLAEAEAGIRRSASARLIVETLLLRWTVMDRIVDLEAVLAGRQSAGGSRPLAAAPAAAPPSRRAAEPPSRPAAEPSSRSAPEPASLEHIRTLWPEIVGLARERSRMVGEALEGAVPVAISGTVIELEAQAGQEFLLQGALARHGAIVQEILGSRLGGPLTVRVARGGGENPGSNPPGDLRAAELTRLRRLDPALDAAATELDLEIVDERLPRSPPS